MKRRILRGALWAAGGAAFFYGLVYADLVLRAREAYLEGEKYLEWQRDPAKKAAHFKKAFEVEKARLEGLRDRGKMDAQEFRQRLELAQFEEEFRVGESSLKYAYVWFQTAVELFSPPESRWVVLSRAKMGETLGLWKKELDQKGVPYEDYMFE